MSNRIRGGYAWLAVCVCLAWTLGEPPQSWKPSRQFLDCLYRIEALRTTTGLSTKEKQDRVEVLDTLGQEIEREWRERDVEGYARLTAELCGTLASIDYATPKRKYLAQYYAMRALTVADSMPLDIECELAGYVRKTTDTEGKPIMGEAGAQLRQQQVSLWLHALHRIDETIDEHWNPNDPNQRDVGNVAPPAGVSPAASGMDSVGIKDPKLRAEYEAAIEADQKKNAYNRLQIVARRLKEHWTAETERDIIRTYIDVPDGAKELEPILSTGIKDSKRRTRILDAVKHQRMPGDLQRGPTTTPVN